MSNSFTQWGCEMIVGFRRAAVTVFALPAFAPVIAAGALVLSAQVSAQETGSSFPDAPSEKAKADSPVCAVWTEEEAGAPGKALLASCDGRGLALGFVDDFQVYSNANQKALIVDSKLGDGRQIWLISTQEDGVPLVEDLGSQIAVAAGRGALSGLDGVKLDLVSFVDAGVIGVVGADQDIGLESMVTIDLGLQIAAERTKRNGGAAS